MTGAEKMFNSRWGVFNHYLFREWPYMSQQKAKNEWKNRTNSLDVDSIAQRLDYVGAKYYFITVMQGSPYLLAPNNTFDEIAGIEGDSTCAERDVISDLYKALEKYGIDLYLYYTGDGPWKDDVIGGRFGFKDPRGNISRGFVEKWASVLEEYSVRYGNKVKGWWIDGCYNEDGFFGYTHDLLKIYHEAIHKGNPDAVVAFNNGVTHPLQKYYPFEEITAGEFADFSEYPTSRFIDGAQAHILAPLGLPTEPGVIWTSWCNTGLKTTVPELCEYARKMKETGVVLSLDVFVDDKGNWDDEQTEALKEIGNVMNA